MKPEDIHIQHRCSFLFNCLLCYSQVCHLHGSRAQLRSEAASLGEEPYANFHKREQTNKNLTKMAFSKETLSGVPWWSGEPADWDDYVIAAKWFRKALKPAERNQAPARLWQALTGSPKDAVKNLDPDEFEDQRGLERFLRVLKDSPLGKLPLQDAFTRIDGYHQVKRHYCETTASYILRENQAHLDLQKALKRLRRDRQKKRQREADSARRTPESEFERIGDSDSDDGWMSVSQQSKASSKMSMDAKGEWYDYETELRGYRLLKNFGLETEDRNSILSATKQSVEYLDIVNQLKAMWGDDEELKRKDRKRTGGGKGKGKGWAKAWSLENGDQSLEENWDPSWQGESWDSWAVEGEDWQEGAWQDDSWYEGSWEEGYDGWQAEAWTSDDWAEDEWEECNWTAEEPIEVPVGADAPTKEVYNQYNSAQALAVQANRTLQQAREAVRQADQNRGFFPGGKGKAGDGGKGKSFGKFKGKGKGKGHKGYAYEEKGKGKDRSAGDGCVICGSQDHWWRQCPDRHAPQSDKGKSKGKSFGKSKGKGKGKGKKGFFAEEKAWMIGNLMTFFFAFPVTVAEATLFTVIRATQIVLDSGATETAGGADAIQSFIEGLKKTGKKFKVQVDRNDKPWFRFADGLWKQALSRVHIYLPCEKWIAIYTLDADTPILGSVVFLENLGSVVDFVDNTLTMKDTGHKITLERAKTGHRLLDCANDIE